MYPLIAVPEIVRYYSPHFKFLFSEAEYDHFQKYLSGLLISENKTIEAINRLFVTDPKDQSSLNRFVNASKHDLTSLNKQRLALLHNQAATQFKPAGHRGGVLSIDDTLLHHFGKSFEGIAYLYDHVSEGYVWAHQLLTLHYSDDQTDYPVLFDLWKPLDVKAAEEAYRSADISIQEKKLDHKVNDPKKWKNYLLYLYRKNEENPAVHAVYRTKILMARQMLVQFFDQYPDLDMPISFDSWFAAPKLCKFIDEQLQKTYVCGIKKDEIMILKGSRKVTVTDFVKQLKEQHQQRIENGQSPLFKKTTIKYKGKKEVYYSYCHTHRFEKYQRQKLLLSFHKEDLSGPVQVFMCNNKTWRASQITRVGRHRWPVEVYHKEGKAEGLDKYQVRNMAAIKKHIALVCLVYSILKHAQHDDVLSDRIQTQLDTTIKGTLPCWRRITKAQSLWLMLQWIDLTLKQQGSLEGIFQTLLPAFAIS